MYTTTLTLVAPTSHVDLAPTCACGQDLERCRGEHCPRCGCTLQHAVTSFAA